MTEPARVLASKAQWRTQIRTTRAAVPAPVRAAEAAALAGHLRTLIRPGSVWCAYLPVGTEPGSVQLLEQLRQGGVRVLLPVAREPAALHWADFAGAEQVRAAPRGLREPTGVVFDPQTVALAEVVLVPALAVDRVGVRLGRGAGFYDRTLPLVDPGARVMAVVRDDELVTALPADAHDVPVGWALTPGGGVHRLGGASAR